jgi:hypothetical protein
MGESRIPTLTAEERETKSQFKSGHPGSGDGPYIGAHGGQGISGHDGQYRSSSYMCSESLYGQISIQRSRFGGFFLWRQPMVRYTCCKCKYVCRYEGKTIGDCTDQTSADGWEPTGKMTERVCKGCRSLGKCLTAVYKNEPVAEGLNKICANVWGGACYRRTSNRKNDLFIRVLREVTPALERVCFTAVHVVVDGVMPNPLVQRSAVLRQKIGSAFA